MGKTVDKVADRWYTRCAVGKVFLRGKDVSIQLTPSTEYASTRGDVKCIAVYCQGHETELDRVLYVKANTEFKMSEDVMKSFDIMRIKHDGVVIKWVFDLRLDELPFEVCAVEI